MSTLIEKIAEALDGHIFDKPVGRCRCNAGMNTTGHRTREHRAHLAKVASAVFAEWLGSDDVRADLMVATGFAPGGLAATATALAAEAVKGAGQ